MVFCCCAKYKENCPTVKVFFADLRLLTPFKDDLSCNSPDLKEKQLTLCPNWFMRTGRTYIMIIMLSGFMLRPGMGGARAAGPSKQFTVVIDAGHGGHDPGAIGRRGKEKNINLNVALKLGRLISRNCGDTRVIYTRTDDTFIPLYRRADIANAAKADLFISIHTNSIASRSTRVGGSETYTLGLYRTEENLEVAKKENSVILVESDYKQRYAGFNPNSAESYIIFEFMQDKYMAQSVDFARKVQRQFRASGRQDKGVHQAGFLVLRATSMPGVLVELGYISNPVEEQYLLSESGTTTLARSIYNAFIAYKQQQGYNSPAPLLEQGREEVAVVEEAAPEMTEVIVTDSALVIQTDSAETRVESQAQSETIPLAPVKQPVRPRQPAIQPKGRPVFKIQILTSGSVLPARSRQFKGLSPVSHYKEGGIVKYTYGEDTDYNKILRLKRQKVDTKFKDAFIIAFKDGEKMNINRAIREFKENR